MDTQITYWRAEQAEYGPTDDDQLDTDDDYRHWSDLLDETTQQMPGRRPVDDDDLPADFGF